MAKTDETNRWPRLRDLPIEEREEFDKWLTGSCCPVGDEFEPRDQWDWYYQHDYDSWKSQCNLT